MKERIWGILLHLSPDVWTGEWNTQSMGEVFDEAVWLDLVDRTAKAGMNTIVVDVANAIRYDSHPEIAKEGAYSVDWMHKQVCLCREKGIALIPKLNFSTEHDAWLGEYSRMVSTSIYYAVAKDLIEEVYEIFDHPEYIHLGMDEESPECIKHSEYAVCRQGELYFHDLKYFCDCVAALGAKPWIWSSPLYDMSELFKEKISKDEIVISPYYYYAFRPEHYTRISSKKLYAEHYAKYYPDLDIEFVEEDPYLVNFRLKALPMLEYGYQYIPCASVDCRCDYNTKEIMEYFKKYANDDQILGYITAPWVMTVDNEKTRVYFEETFRLFREAREQVYGE